MKHHNKNSLRVVVLSALLATTSPLLAFQDPTQVPAFASKRMQTSPMTAIAQANQRLIAVGQRGHIAYSDDQGHSWTQAQSPVSSDLVAVHFADANHGWAVGHGGIVLHSSDAGQSWQTQLNGTQTSALIKDFYKTPNIVELFDNAGLFVEREEILDSYGGTQPLMAVHFIDAKQGFVAGLFNRLLFTDDGGQTWQPWQHRVENSNELHFYAFAQGPAGLFITGEQGKVWRFESQRNYFVDVSTGYTGTLFGGFVQDDVLLVYGMRGSLFRSTDAGASWQRIEVNTTAGITSARAMRDKSIVLGTLSGEILVSRDHGLSFKPTRLKDSMPYFDLSANDDSSLALAGARGLQRSAPLNADTRTAKSSTTLLGGDHGRQH